MPFLQENYPFFVIGHKRGGTTLLRLMLNKHTRLVLPPESHFIQALVQHLPLEGILTPQQVAKACDLVIGGHRFNTWSIAADDLRQSTIGQTYTLTEFINHVFALQCADSGKPRWGEKTPEYVDILPQLHTLYPQAVFLLMTRDGRDVSISLNKRGWEGWTEYQRATYWSRTIRNMLALEKTDAKSLLFQYESLAASPEATLQKVCTAIGEAYEPDMIRFHEDFTENITEKEKASGVHVKLGRAPKKDDVGLWKTTSSKTAVFMFECVAYKELLAAGYALDQYRPNAVFHQLLRFLYIAFGAVTAIVFKTYHFLFSKQLKMYLRQFSFYNKVKGGVRKA